MNASQQEHIIYRVSGIEAAFFKKTTDAGEINDNETPIMLVTFSCSAYPDITMLGDVAVRLIKLMGHSGAVPSALLTEDVPAALARLDAGVAASELAPAAEQNDDEDAVSVAQRALPLIELLRAAAKATVNVMWDKNS
jgi:hypothetical protein